MRALITAESAQRARTFLLFTMVVFAPVIVEAQTFNLAWDASTDPAVVGYTVHVGINPGVYGQTFLVNGQTTTTFAFTQAVPGQRYYFAVSAYDASNASSGLSNVVSAKINVGPTLTQPANQTTSVGSAASLQLVAVDDGDPLTFTASGLPAGMSINAGTGRITGTPIATGSRTVTVSVSDGLLSASRIFTWMVASPSSGPLTVTSLTGNLASPQVTGKSITFTTTASGGVAPYQYKWWLFNGSTWTVLQNWSGSSTFTWTPTQVNSNYGIGAWVRSATNTADTNEASLWIPYVIAASTSTTSGAPAPSGPLTIANFTSSVPSPRVTGTSITFSAVASGGVAPYQYKFLLYDGNNWAVARDWSAANTYTWTPLQPNLYYRVSVWVRNATTTADVRDADVSMPYPIIAPPSGGPLTVTALTSNLATPQATGTAITFTARASGGTAPYSFKWWLYDGTNWTVLQNWSGNDIFTWTPTQARNNYQIGVWVRNATTLSDINEASVSVPYVITPSTGGTPLTVTSFTSSVPSPRLMGTPITFTAAASGGTAPYQYKYLVSNGSTWTVASGWSGSNVYTWTPLQADANYRVAVWVRNATTTADVSDANAAMPYPITAPASGGPLSITGLPSHLASPQVTGTAITFTAKTSGGIGPHQYKWWFFNGSTWTVLQNWGGSNTFTWTPTQANSNYGIGVWVRSATTTADINEASLWVPYVITPSTTASTISSSTTAPSSDGPLTITMLLGNLASPQRAGTPITFTAKVSGGSGPHQYKWWVYNGSVWTIVQNWSTSSTFTWTPMLANGNYGVGVWVRNAGTTADVNQASLWIPYVIVP